jgi:hypothetical protein
MNMDRQKKRREYTIHVVAYFDVVGFKEKVKQSRDCPDKIGNIVDALGEAHFKADRWANAKLMEKVVSTRDLRVGIPLKPISTFPNILSSHFSDTVLISLPDPDSFSLYLFLSIVSGLQYTMILRDCYPRGAVTIGPHYHQGDVAFGPAFIKAYELEKCAVWPRLVVDPLMLARPECEGMSESPMSILRDVDGLLYLNYLEEEVIISAVNQWQLEYRSGLYPTLLRPLEVISAHREAILRAVEVVEKESNEHHSTKLNPNLLKYHRLATYHNAVIERLYLGVCLSKPGTILLRGPNI